MRSSKYPENVYTEKLQISAVDMTKIDLATEEDKRNHIDMWARLFMAASWEEVKMIAEKNPEMEQTASSIWQLTAEKETWASEKEALTNENVALTSEKEALTNENAT